MNNFIKNVSSQVRNVVQSQLYLFKIMLHDAPFHFAVSAFTEIMNGFLPLFTAFLWKVVIDKITIFYETMTVAESLYLFIGIYIATDVISSIINRCCSVVSGDLGNKIEYKVNLQMMDAMSNLENSFFDDPKNRDILNKMNQYKGRVSYSISRGISLVVAVISLITGLCMFVPYNPLLGIIYIVTFIPGSIAEYKAKKKLDYYSINSIPETRKKDYYKTVLTDASYAKDVRLYNLADYLKDKYNTLWNSIRKERTELFRKETHAAMLSGIFSSIGLIMILCWSVHSILAGTMSLGMLSMYVSLSKTVGKRFNYLSISLPLYVNVTVPQILSYKKFTEIYSACDEKDAILHVPSMLTIEFCNVYFKYPGSDDYVINNLSFIIESGEKIALLGENGAGKSTIIKLLLRFYEPQSGEILLNGKNIKLYSIESVRKLFGVCFQDINKYSLLFRENIAISDVERINDTDAVQSAAKLSGADKIYLSLPNGIDSNITRNFDNCGYEPSGGQWQKIGISRAAFRNSDIIILDEPSSALDPEAEDFIFKQFRKLCSNKSGILISHRLSCISIVDKVILIDKGTLVECGTHDELMSNNGRYAYLYRLQAGKYRETT